VKLVLKIVAGVILAATLTMTASAAVIPGTYRGSLYLASGKKIPGSPATVIVAGRKVTIKVAKFPIKCLAPTGKLVPSTPIRYLFKGTITGNKVSGTFLPPLGGNGEYLAARGTFSRATRSFTGTLTSVGALCRGTSTIKARKV
jgi:hypothetical protein